MSSCTDFASRLTSATGTSSIVYNGRGDAVTVGDQSFTFDATDQVIAGTAAAGQQVTYTRDATGRVITRVGSGTGPGVDTSTTTYSYTSSGDTADLQLTATNTIGERYLALPGGVLFTKRYANPGGDVWALSNIHGDTLATTNATGVLVGQVAVYDPFGNPLNPTTGLVDQTTTPTTRTGGLTDGWVGANQRGTEHTGGATWTLMGARLYLPALGQYASTDPVEGGTDNTYSYVNDPINAYDLTGQLGCGAVSRKCPGLTAANNPPINWRSVALFKQIAYAKYVGFLAASYTSITGGSCWVQRGLRVCQGGWGHAYMRGGTTLGTTYVAAPGAEHTKQGVLEHESVHVQQWRALGYAFPAMYFSQGLNACHNGFEIGAGLSKGGYTWC